MFTQDFRRFVTWLLWRPKWGNTIKISFLGTEAWTGLFGSFLFLFNTSFMLNDRRLEKCVFAEHCLTHLNKTACETWSVFDKVHFWVKNLAPFFQWSLQINEVKLIETQLIKFAFLSIPFLEGFSGKRALGFLLKSERFQKRSKFHIPFCLGALNNVLYVFLLKFASFSRYYVCKKACICG